MSYDWGIIEEFDYYGNRYTNYFNEVEVEKTYYKIKSKEQLEEFEKYQKANSGSGNCFEKNYELFMKLSKTNPHIKFCITSQTYIKSGKSIEHAFCLDGDFIIDVAQKTNMKLTRAEYESNYRIDGYNIWNIHNIKPLKYYLDNYKRPGVREFYYGNIPVQKGKWEVSKDSIINL